MPTEASSLYPPFNSSAPAISSRRKPSFSFPFLAKNVRKYCNYSNSLAWEVSLEGAITNVVLILILLAYYCQLYLLVFEPWTVPGRKKKKKPWTWFSLACVSCLFFLEDRLALLFVTDLCFLLPSKQFFVP